MKRVKRHPVEKAYHQGYKAGIRGHSGNICPYTLGDTRGLWFGGWRDGRSQFLAGFLSSES
ncbi:MAG: ribosome modulation factor [Francisellaceae bacterium]|nr:ribosome modulation factor [Francisellaceae bacterium]